MTIFYLTAYFSPFSNNNCLVSLFCLFPSTAFHFIFSPNAQLTLIICISFWSIINNTLWLFRHEIVQMKLFVKTKKWVPNFYLRLIIALFICVAIVFFCLRTLSFSTQLYHLELFQQITARKFLLIVCFSFLLINLYRTII